MKVKTLLILSAICLLLSACENNATSSNNIGNSGNDEILDTLPNEAIAYLDKLLPAQYDINEAVLPNGKNLGEYLKEMEIRARTEVNRNGIFPNDAPTDQLSQLFVKFLTNANDLVDDSKHQYPRGTDDTEPSQNGLAYNYGSREFSSRKKMYSATCNKKVFGLDCSGFLFQVFKKSGCNGMNISALDQSKPANLNAAISGVVNGVEAKDKGKLNSASIESGDIIYWDKVGGNNASHIGIALKKSDGSLVVFQSNGRSDECDGNLASGRGPRTFAVIDTYWFASNCNWKVLRYEVS